MGWAVFLRQDVKDVDDVAYARRTVHCEPGLMLRIMYIMFKRVG